MRETISFVSLVISCGARGHEKFLMAKIEIKRMRRQDDSTFRDQSLSSSDEKALEFALLARFLEETLASRSRSHSMTIAFKSASRTAALARASIASFS